MLMRGWDSQPSPDQPPNFVCQIGLLQGSMWGIKQRFQNVLVPQNLIFNRIDRVSQATLYISGRWVDIYYLSFYDFLRLA